MRALVISGGGSKGAFAGGVAQYLIEIEKNKLIDDELTIPEKPFLCWKTGSLSNYYNSLLLNFCKEKGIPLDVPFKFLTENHKNLL